MYNGDTCSSTVLCYEYFFSQPITVSGNIYLTGKIFRTELAWPLCYGYDTNANQRWVSLRNYPPYGSYVGDLNHVWGGLFPIIKNSCDSCPEVHNVRFSKISNKVAKAQWDAGTNHNKWQIRYGNEGLDTNSGGTLITTTDTQGILNVNISTLNYDVYIRAYCNCCGTEEWSPWVGPFNLYLPTLGIDDEESVEAEISPNPTTGTLTVGCEAAIDAVELYDMQGRCALSRECNGNTMTLDLTALPAGTYVLVAHTDKGLATRTVEKR